MYIEDFKEFYLQNEYDENMFNADGSLNHDYNSFKKTGIISDIFEDWWDFVYSKYGEYIDKYKPNASAEVKKIIDCHNKNLGCSVYL